MYEHFGVCTWHMLLSPVGLLIDEIPTRVHPQDTLEVSAAEISAPMYKITRSVWIIMSGNRLLTEYHRAADCMPDH